MVQWQAHLLRALLVLMEIKESLEQLEMESARWQSIMPYQRQIQQHQLHGVPACQH